MGDPETSRPLRGRTFSKRRPPLPPIHIAQHPIIVIRSVIILIAPNVSPADGPVSALVEEVGG